MIHFANVREVGFADDYFVTSLFFLEPLKNVEPAPSPVALDRVRAVGHLLKLAQYELRDYQHAREKTRLGDIRDTAVDND